MSYVMVHRTAMQPPQVEAVLGFDVCFYHIAA